MPITVTRLTPHFATRIDGADLTRPLATEFASGRATWPSLPEPLRRRAEASIAIHNFAWSRDQVRPGFFTDTERAEYPPVRHPVVRVT